VSRLQLARAALSGLRGLSWSEDLPVIGIGYRFTAQGRDPVLTWHTEPESELARALQAGRSPWIAHAVHVGSESKGKTINAVVGQFLRCYLLAARRRFRGCTEVQARLCFVVEDRPILASFGGKAAKVEGLWTAARGLARTCGRYGLPTGVVQVSLQAGAVGACPVSEPARARFSELCGGAEPTEAELDPALADPAGPLWPELVRLSQEATAWARDERWASEDEGPISRGE